MQKAVFSHIIWLSITAGVVCGQEAKTELQQMVPSPHGIYSVASDANGFVWIGTENGLFRHDKTRLTRFSFDPDNPNSLSHNYVPSIAIDHEGIVWIGTARGLDRLDPVSGEIRHFIYDENDPSSIPRGNVIAAFVDRSNRLWIGSAGGAALFDRQTQTFHRFEHIPGDSTTIGGPFIGFIEQDSRGRMWFGAWRGGGLSRLDDPGGPFVRYPVQGPSYPADLISFIKENQDTSIAGFMQIGSEADLSEAFTLDISGFFLIVSSHEYLSGESDDLGWLEDKAGNTIWSATTGTCRHGGGAIKNWLCIDVLELQPGDYTIRFIADPIHAYDDWNAAPPNVPEWWGIKMIPLTPRDADHLKGLTLQAVKIPKTIPGNALGLHAQGDTLWIGTSSGLVYYDNIRDDIVRQSIQDENTESSSVVWGVQSIENELWIVMEPGLESSFAGVLDVGTGEFSPATGIPQTLIQALHITEAGDLWAMTSDQGMYVRAGSAPVFQLEYSGREITALRVHASGKVDLASTRDCSLSEVVPDRMVCTGYLESDAQTSWIGTTEGVFRISEGTIRHYEPNPLDAGSLRGNIVSDMLVDRSGAVWIVTRDIDWIGGASRFNGEDFDVIRYNPNDPAALGGPRPTDIHEDREGRIWITHQYGFDLIEDNGSSLRHFSTPTGYPLQVISEDENGILWLGDSQGGVHLFDPETNEIIGELDGNLQDFNSAVSMQADMQGGMWIAFSNYGIVRFETEASGRRAFTERDGLPTAAFTFHTSGIDSSGVVYFGTESGLLSIDTSALERVGPGAPLFTDFRVHGELQLSTPDWEPPVGSTEISVRLATSEYFKPATYEYRLAGYDDEWIDVDPADAIVFHRLPVGTYLLEGRKRSIGGSMQVFAAPVHIRIRDAFWRTELFRWLLAAGLLFLGYVAYTWRRRHFRIVEDIKRQIASDLHDDVGSQLSGIKIMVGLAADDSLSAIQRKAELERIAQTSDDVLDALREMVWFISPSVKNTDQLLERMRNHAERHTPSMSVKFDVSQPHVLDTLPLRARREFILIFKEAVRNIGQHSKAQNVHIQARATADQVILMIDDDGIGFDTEKSNGGYGLQSMQYRAKKINGELSIQSEPGKGTRFKLVVSTP